MERPYVASFCSQKGGTGKTTSCVNVGAALAEEGFRPLLVDLDPQGGLTRYLLGPKAQRAVTEEASIRAALTGAKPIVELIRPTACGLDVVPAHEALATVAVEVKAYAEQRLADALTGLSHSEVADEHRYDYVLIDCPPSLDLLPLNAMHASDGLVLLVTPEVLPAQTLPAVMRVVKDVVQLGKRTDLRILGVLPCMARRRTLLTRTVSEYLPQLVPGVPVLPEIGLATKVAEAPLRGLPVLAYAPRHRASDEYRAVTRALRVRMNGGR